MKKYHYIQKTSLRLRVGELLHSDTQRAAYSGLEKLASELEGWDFNSSAKPLGV